MSRKQLLSRIGFGRKKDSNASTSPAHQSNGSQGQYMNQQQVQQYSAFQEAKQSQNYVNGTNNVNGNNYNQNGAHFHNQSRTNNHYPSGIHNSAPNSHTVHSPKHSGNGSAKDVNHYNNNNNNTNSKSSRSHNSKSRNKHSHSNGKRKHKHSERMTIETSALSTTMSQEDVAKLLRLDNMPNYRADERGYIDFSRGLFIDQRFIILETLGRGTFSKVFEAIDVVDKTKIAIKVIRNSHRYIEAAKTELRVLQHITNADDGRSCCIHLKDHFHWNKHPVLVFKLYGPSIYTVMAKNHYRPFPDYIVKQLTVQICTAIQFMHHLGIIFTDLKPENMVFIDGRTQMVVNANGKQEFIPIDARIKLVDFGSAVYEPIFDPNNPKTHKFKNGYNYLIQTRHYRAPEVVLEMPWKRQVDVWSIGCVILEFLYGSMVFNTHCAIDHLNQMQKMIGKLPHRLIKDSSDKAYEELFTSDGKLNLEKAKISRAQAKPLRAYFNLESVEHQALYDLVQRTLRWEAKDRITADAILRHAYFQINTPMQQQAQLQQHAQAALQQQVQAQAQAQAQQQQQQQQQHPQQNGFSSHHSQHSQSYSTHSRSMHPSVQNHHSNQQILPQKVVSSPKNGYNIQAPTQQAPQIPQQQQQQQQAQQAQQGVYYTQQQQQQLLAHQQQQQQRLRQAQAQAQAQQAQSQAQAQGQYVNGKSKNQNGKYSQQQPYITH